MKGTSFAVNHNYLGIFQASHHHNIHVDIAVRKIKVKDHLVKLCQGVKKSCISKYEFKSLVSL